MEKTIKEDIKNILIINSSARSNGNTERLLKLLENQLLKKADECHLTLDITHVYLFRQDIQICRGCRACFDKGSCPLKDDVEKIEELVLNCDALILASPVYLEDVNGIMKNWLDRMAFHSHRPAFYGKYAVVISTSGSGSSNHSLNTMKNALTAWGFHVLSAEKFRMGAYMEDEQIEKQYKLRLFHLAGSLINSIIKGVAQNPTLFSLISFYIQQKYYRQSNHAGIKDRIYWEKQGWLDPHVHYYSTKRYNPIKLFLARVLGAFISKMFF